MIFYKDKFCLAPISKDLKGDLTVRDEKADRCKRPRCITLKVRYRLEMELSSHKRCDKLPRLNGKFRANLYVATQTDGHGRGFHQARFQWLTGPGSISGSMRGITNAGTHRRPPLKDCEPCDARGHMEGQLEGIFRDGLYKGCRVRASYVINYDPGVSGQNTGVRGTLEGVRVCPCR